MREPQYIDLDVAPIFEKVPVNQYGVVIAHTIENTPWYVYEDPRIDPKEMKRIVNKLKKSSRRSFSQTWEELKDYADQHNIWINEK